MACVLVASAQSGSFINIDDVTRFYRVFDAAKGQPTVDQLQRDYLDRGTDGLRSFVKARNVTAARIADAIVKQPELYTDARRCLAVLPRVRSRLQGYCIVKTHYGNAPDKRRALKEIFGITSARTFLADSGWTPGIQLH